MNSVGGFGLFDNVSDRAHTEARIAEMQAAAQTASALRDLEFEVARQKLLMQAMWELIRDRARLTDADLEAKAQEIDLRDGVQDGRITDGPLRCPSCGRVSNSKHWRCLYCGQQFEKPAMG